MAKRLTPTTKRTYYASLTSQELENILKLDFQYSTEESMFSEDMQIILSILVQREKNSPNISEFDVEKSWNSFKNNYLPFVKEGSTLYNSDKNTCFSKRYSKRLICKKNITAILVFLIMFTTISQTTIAKNLVSSIANWSRETFWFEANTSSNNQCSSKNLDIDVSNIFNFTTLPPNLLPTWIPNNYAKIDEDSLETDDFKMYQAFFEDENNDAFINLYLFYLYNNINITFEKDDSDVETYEKDGITYYIMGNLNTNTAIWCNGSFQCQISGTLSREELKKIIDSIPSPN